MVGFDTIMSNEMSETVHFTPAKLSSGCFECKIRLGEDRENFVEILKVLLECWRIDDDIVQIYEATLPFECPIGVGEAKWHY